MAPNICVDTYRIGALEQLLHFDWSLSAIRRGFIKYYSWLCLDIPRIINQLITIDGGIHQ
jgi:hypothetical protein